MSRFWLKNGLMNQMEKMADLLFDEQTSLFFVVIVILTDDLDDHQSFVCDEK